MRVVDAITGKVRQAQLVPDNIGATSVLDVDGEIYCSDETDRLCILEAAPEEFSDLATAGFAIRCVLPTVH